MLSVLPLDQLPSRIPACGPGAPVPRAPKAPGWCPFSVVRDFYARGQGPRKGFLVSNFTMFHVSTKCPQPAGSYPPQAQNPPQQIHRQQAVPAPASYSGASPKLPTGPGPEPCRVNREEHAAEACAYRSGQPVTVRDLVQVDVRGPETRQLADRITLSHQEVLGERAPGRYAHHSCRLVVVVGCLSVGSATEWPFCCAVVSGCRLSRRMTVAVCDRLRRACLGCMK